MMTLTQTERMVRKIAEMAAQPSSDTQTAKLAHDYAEICRAANRRLEQCALMIEAGQFLQALQLAETAPPLMDLITLLSFRQAAEWRAHCQGHQLPWSEPFYDKYIRLLNETYGKGIASDHPFYRDYRRAVMENDDARAFSILKVISRLNPSDPNTKEELKRLEEKLLRVKLESLKQLVTAGDPASIEAALEQLEASGLPVPSSHPAWQQAQIFRCQRMIRRAEELRQQGLWEEAEVAVEEIHATATRYNLRLPDADADTWTALEEWTGQQRAAWTAEQDFRRAVSALEFEAGSIAARRDTAATLNKADAAAMFETLASKQEEAGRFGKPLPDGLEDRCQQGREWLQSQMRAAKARGRVLNVAVLLVILAAIGASTPFVLRWQRQQNYEQRFKQLASARNVSETENLMSRAPASWKSNPKMADSLSQAKDFVAREKELKQDFDRKLAGLQQIAAAGFRGDPAQAGADRASCEQALNQLAPEYKSAAAGALGAWDAQWKAFRNGELGRVLDKAEQAAGALDAGNGAAAVRAAISQLQAMLPPDVAALEASPPPLPAEMADRFGRLTNKIGDLSTTVEKWDQSQDALGRASSLEEYLAGMDQLALSPLASTAQKASAERVDSLRIDQEMLLGQLLLPNDRAAWDSLTNVTGWNASLMPEQPTSQEKDLYFKLRDDKNVTDVNAYELVAKDRPGNGSVSHPVFVQGKIAPDNSGNEAGMVDDPAKYRDRLRFIHTSYSDWDYSDVRWLKRLSECDSYERLGLGQLIDANTGNYQKPILQIIDQLNQDTNSSAVFRAFVIFKLLAVAGLRPSEWGLTWAPNAAAYVQGLTELGAKDIQSGDWLVPDRSDRLERPLEEFFAKAAAVPLEKQARFLQQLVRETCSRGFVFAGFMDDAGHPAPRALAGLPSELCGWNRDGAAVILLRKDPRGGSYAALADPLPYSPLLAFSGDRRQLLAQTLSATGFPAALAGRILPPFFEGAL
ncbi:MAG TPA: hypothetical protein VGO59_18305 [Verrucomicrobiae bacterium]